MKICVYAICKNESKFIESWLNSMSEADYIVVLDTGSTDDTYEKLKADSRVTKVRQKEIHPWRFDVARNESMKLIPKDTDVCVCTDFDEVFNPGWAQVIRDHWEIGKFNRGFYTYAWSHNSVGEPQDVFIYDKMHTLKDYHWIFPVHEVLVPNDGVESVPLHFKDQVYLHHYPDKEKSRSYYMDLLKLSCEEHPDDCHVHMLYAREILVTESAEAALPEFTKVLSMPDIDNAEKKPVLLNTLFQIALIYAQLKNYDEALWYCQEFIKEDYTYREPYLLMAEVYNNMKMYTLAESCIRAAEEYAYQHYSWVERATTYTSWLPDVASISEANLGKVEKACEYVEEALKHDPENVRLIKNQNLYLKQYINILEKQKVMEEEIETSQAL